MKILVVSVMLLVAQGVYSVPVVSDAKHIEVSKAQVETPPKVQVAHEEVKTLPATIGTIQEHVNEINPLVLQWLEYIENYFVQLMYPDRYNRILEPYYNPERYEGTFYPYYNSYRYNRILYPYYNQDLQYVEPNGLRRPLESNFIIPYLLNQRIFNPFRREFLRDREEELSHIERSGGYDSDDKTYVEGYDSDDKTYVEGYDTAFDGEGFKGYDGDKWHQGKEGNYDKWDHDKLGHGGKVDHEKEGYDHEEEHSKGKW